jgi:hypothetical protein
MLCLRKALCNSLPDSAPSLAVGRGQHEQGELPEEPPSLPLGGPAVARGDRRGDYVWQVLSYRPPIF